MDFSLLCLLSSVHDGSNSCDIFTMNADGSLQTRLTVGLLGDNDPVWVPDGAKIGFWSYRNYRKEIFVMNADGSNQVKGVTKQASVGYKALHA